MLKWVRPFLRTGMRFNGEWMCLHVPSILFSYGAYVAGAVMVLTLALTRSGDSMLTSNMIPAKWEVYAVAIAIATIFFCVCWAIKRYTQFNADRDLTRKDNKFTFAYAAGTVMAMPLAGVITYYATGIVMIGFFGIADLTLGGFIGAGVLFSFLLSGFFVVACHEGVTTATRWLAQGVKEVKTSVEEIAAMQAELAAARAELAKIDKHDE